MLAAGVRRVGGTIRHPGSRVSITLKEPLNTQLRAIAASEGRQLATMLQQWISERAAELLAEQPNARKPLRPK